MHRTLSRYFNAVFLSITSAAWLCAQEEPTRSAQGARFTHRSATVGERMVQDTQFRLAMETTMHREGQPIVTDSTEMVRSQRRRITALETDAGHLVSVEVTFEKADQIFRQGDQAAKQMPQPVAGKTYRVTRKEDKLTITDSAGRIPPMEEYEVVLQSMATIGRPNPLAVFLSGRFVAVGQTLALPKEIAKNLLGGVDQENEITRFDLTLRTIQTSDRSGRPASDPPAASSPCALFDVRIEARSPSHVQMGMWIEGTLAIEVATCRTVQARLHGPIGLTQSSGPVGAHSLITGRGRIEIASASEYLRK